MFGFEFKRLEIKKWDIEVWEAKKCLNLNVKGQIKTIKDFK